MKILLTGATGFLGNYFLKADLGEIVTLGKSSSNTISCDLSDQVPDIPQVEAVIHSAGWAHRIPNNPDQESKFYQVNLFGTQNLVTGLNNMAKPPKYFIFISTVAVYGLEEGMGIEEQTLPEPSTPYAKSKYEAELLLQNWARSNGIMLVILRLPLIAGGHNTPGNLGAMIKAIRNGYYFRVGNGLSKKSMVLAEDIASFVPSLWGQSGTFNLTDGVHPSVADLDNYLSQFFGKKVRTLPKSILFFLAKFGDRFSFFPFNSYRLQKMNNSLTFDDSKARSILGWNPRPVLGNLDLKK